MTPQQILTVRRIAPAVGTFIVAEGLSLWFARWQWATVFVFLFAAYALYVEMLAVQQGGQSTESELTWVLWAQQPWVLWLGSVLAALVCGFVLALHFDKRVLVVVLSTFVAGFLSGHFFAQASDVYVAMRTELDPKRRTDVTVVTS